MYIIRWQYHFDKFLARFYSHYTLEFPLRPTRTYDEVTKCMPPRWCYYARWAPLMRFRMLIFTLARHGAIYYDWRSGTVETLPSHCTKLFHNAWLPAYLIPRLPPPRTSRCRKTRCWDLPLFSYEMIIDVKIIGINEKKRRHHFALWREEFWIQSLTRSIDSAILPFILLIFTHHYHFSIAKKNITAPLPQ